MPSKPFLLCVIVEVSFLLLASQTQATCENNYNCTTCTMDSSASPNNVDDCGWEEDQQQCRSGSSSGPNSGSSASWIWISSGCRVVDPCGVHISCSDCIAAGSCGWDTYFCRTGTSSGPQYGTAANWYWTSCTTPSGTPAPTTTPGTCSSYSGCTACTEGPSDTCGWEDDSQRCATGDITGPTNGVSASWVWPFRGCPSEDPCAGGNTNCDSCLIYPSCGWDTYFCRTGSSSGPSYGTASSWYWSSCSNTPSPPRTSTPSPSSSSSIVVEECTAEDCGSGCQTKNLVAGCTSGIDGSGTSQLLFCVGSDLHQQLYNTTESCSGAPADEFEYPAGLCVPSVSADSSMKVISCPSP